MKPQRQRMKPRRQQRVHRAVIEPIAEAGTAPRWRPKPMRQPKRQPIPKLPPLILPQQVAEGPSMPGYRGAKIRKGMHVQRCGENTPGVVVALGPEQSVVKWFRIGAQQAEVTRYLEEFDDSDYRKGKERW